MGRVTGKVTLDGQAMEGVTVEFQPQKGSPSYGETDSKGRYDLQYSADRPGAEVGQHTVRISTYRTLREGENNIVVPERIPEEYNVKSTMLREVKPGSQTFDFDIETE